MESSKITNVYTWEKYNWSYIITNDTNGIVVGDTIFIKNKDNGHIQGDFEIISLDKPVIQIKGICKNETNIYWFKSINRKNCDNKPTEYIEALCHIIPDMIDKDNLTYSHEKLKVSSENLQAYKINIENEKNKYKDLIKNKYHHINKYNLNKEIEYIYIPGKIRDKNIPLEIDILVKKYDLKENKSDYYIKYLNGDICGFSVKDSENATKTNYSVEKCVKGKDPVYSNVLTEIRKSICIKNGVKNNNKIGGARDPILRNILNKEFKRDDEYHKYINNFINKHNKYVKNYIVNNMYSVNVDYPLYECIKGEIFNINKKDIIDSKLESYSEAEIKKNGEKRDIAKLFYKLIITFKNDIKKEYRIETRTKGSWWSGSVQFQSHLI